MRRDVPWFRIGGVAALGVVIVAVVLVVRGGQQVPDSVQPIAWNHQPCAHCQMLVGAPGHAAQLITTAGDVLVFDDPGCALRHLEAQRPALHRLWFHHATADRWLEAADTAFLTGGETPMGSGLLAVERGTAGAIDLAAATTWAHSPRPAAVGQGAAKPEAMP